MPALKVERIVSFNSEDPVHVANNLLSNDISKKWKCKSAGEKSASVVLQLDQPRNITGIDIGNEHSAYIEVLVSRSGSPDDYKVLLVMSSFMTPLESRQSQNINKVRMFQLQDLSEPEKNEKWDRIKVVCSQPFNRHVQYGLSFIKLYSAESKDEPPKQRMGKFLVRPESPDSISAGSLFAMQKKIKEDSLKGAAAIRESSTAAQSGSPLVKQKLKLNITHTNSPKASVDSNTNSPRPRNRNELLYNKDEEEANEKIDKLVQNKAKEKAELEEEQTKKNEESKKIKKQQKNVDIKKPTGSGDIINTNTDTKIKENKKASTSMKRKSSGNSASRPKKIPKKEKPNKPFARLLEGVVLVISGIQNPDRANLRTMALSMGARYKPDWDPTCTHLICAFTNTPKFKQVKGKGKIVKKTWIEDCYKERKRFPWRRYVLDKADEGPESEEEIWETESSPPPRTENDNESDTDDDTVEEVFDVDDKIKEIQEKQQKLKKHNIFETFTDSEPERDVNSDNLEFKNKLEDIFENKIFYVDDIFGQEQEKKIKQYVVAYNGLIADNLENSIDVIVTNKTNSISLKDLYPLAICISPDWIWECHNTQSLASMDGFIFE